MIGCLGNVYVIVNLLEMLFVVSWMEFIVYDFKDGYLGYLYFYDNVFKFI